MGRVNSNRKTAEALRKTLEQLEADPNLNSRDAAFINLKSAILQRLTELEVDPSILAEDAEHEPADAAISASKGDTRTT